MDAVAPPLEDLIPGTEEVIPGGISIKIETPLRPAPGRRFPGWIMALAGAAAALLLALPFWLLSSDEPQPVIATSPSTVENTQPALPTTTAPPSTTLPEPTGDNPHIGLDEPFGNVSGHEFASSTSVMLRVNEGPWRKIGITDAQGSFGYSGVVDVGPGDTIDVEVGGVFRKLEVPAMTFDVYDSFTRIASGSTDLEDGTRLSLHVFPQSGPPWVTYEVVVSGGKWSFEVPIDFSEGWPNADITWFPEGAVYSVHFRP